MPRPEKVQAVADIRESVDAASAVFLAEYAGLSVKEQQQLRRSLREVGGQFRVVKMTLARMAVDDLGHDGLADLLVGPTGLAFAEEDAAAAAKVLKDFAKDHTRLVLKGGLLGADFLTPERVSQLADLEPREVQLAKIAGAMQAPMAKMAGLMAAFNRNMATMLLQLIEKTPADEPAAAPPAADQLLEEMDAATETDGSAEAPAAKESADDGGDASPAGEAVTEAPEDGDLPDAEASTGQNESEDSADEADEDAAVAAENTAESAEEE